MISSRTARRWFNQLGFSWRDIKKGVFFDGHERDGMVEYRKQFLESVHYILVFNADRTIQSKEYPQDCCIGRPGRRLVISITSDEGVFDPQMMVGIRPGYRRIEIVCGPKEKERE
jgi:hypothetical protein